MHFHLHKEKTEQTKELLHWKFSIKNIVVAITVTPVIHSLNIYLKDGRVRRYTAYLHVSLGWSFTIKNITVNVKMIWCVSL